MFDVIFYDEHGAWSPEHNLKHPVGGFEVYQVQMARWFASQGLSVLCFQNADVEKPFLFDGVGYRKLLSRQFFGHVRCRALIVARNSNIPEWIHAERVFASAVDDPRYRSDTYEHQKGKLTQVCISDWQAGLYRELGHEAVTIHSVLDDDIYETRRGKNARDYVCVNAWNKGTDATLAAWKRLKARFPGWTSVLRVGSPYSHPNDAADRCAAAGAEWIGALRPRHVVYELANAEAVFRVNDRHPETFGVTDAIAEAVGTRVHCLFTPGTEMAAAPEALSSPYLTDSAKDFDAGILFPNRPYPKTKDWRVSTVMPRWIDVLGLGS